MITRVDIIDAARTYKDVPFKMAGRNRRGIDCVGIPLCLARDFAVTGWEAMWGDMAHHAYPTIREVGFLRGVLDGLVDQGYLFRVDKSLCKPGDMLLCFTGAGHDHHVCFFMPPVAVLEARSTSEARYPTGRVVENEMTTAKWRSVMQGYQFAEVN